MRLRLSLGVAFTALVLALPTQVAAHAGLVSAVPGPDDVITEVPSELVAHFSQNLDPERSSIELRSGGQTLARGGYDASAPDERTMRLDLPTLPPGTYEVRWTTLSTEDDELERDTYTFTVLAATPSPAATIPPAATPSAPAASGTPVPAATPTLAPTASPGPGGEAPGDDLAQVAVPIVVGLALAAGIAGWLLRRRTSVDR